MRILITGGNGQLGSELQRILSSGLADIGPIDPCYHGAEVVAVGTAELDITDSAAVDDYLAHNSFDYLINCAAATNVDGCESDPAQAMRVNGAGPGNLARACEEQGIVLVHISTDYVFPGNAPRYLDESDTCNPRSEYGKSKYAGELAVRQDCKRYFIMRTSWLYGMMGNNFVRTVLRVAKTHDSMTVVNDQIGTPTNANDLAYEILKLMRTDNYGIYHCTGNGRCSWFDFACAIVQAAGLNMKVMPCSSDEYAAAHPQSAKRPAYSILDNKHLRKTVGDEMRAWPVALGSFIEKLEKQGEI